MELKNKESKEVEKLLEHQKLLSDPSKQKIVDLGNGIFPNSKKAELENELGRFLEKQKVETTIVGLKENYKHVFTGAEICQERHQYNLKFEKSVEYQGDFDYTYIERIQTFLDKNSLEINKFDLDTKFYILTHSKVKNPLIFYKHVENNKNYYVLIDGDLSYKNLFNWIMGYINSTELSFLTFLFLILSSIASFIFSFFIGYGGILAGVVFSFVFTSIVCMGTENSKIKFNKYKLRHYLPESEFDPKLKDFQIVGALLIILLYVPYLGSSIKYTINPKLITKTIENKLSYDEIIALGMKPEPNKKYFTKKENIILKKGHIFYTSTQIVNEGKTKTYATECNTCN